MAPLSGSGGKFMENMWEIWEMKAKNMDDYTLLCAIKDCVETALHFDKMDREMNTNVAGQYRDECSVYRTELASRRAK
jgi:hypothetical protein